MCRTARFSLKGDSMFVQQIVADRRKSHRRRVKWLVGWRSPEYDGEAEVLDVSPWGLFMHVRGDVQPRVGELVWIRFSVQHRGESLTAAGTVVRHGPSLVFDCDGFGVQFDAVQVQLFNNVWQYVSVHPAVRARSEHAACSSAIQREVP